MNQPLEYKKGHGYIEDVVKDEDYKLGDGKLQAVVLQVGGHGWGTYLPEDQIQDQNGLETMNCTNYGTLHALATLMKRLFPNTANGFAYSERYTGVCTGTTTDGNSPKNVIEIIRTSCGLINEGILPFTSDIDTWEEYYSPNPMTPDLVDLGRSWLLSFKVGDDWVLAPNKVQSSAKQIALLKSALQYSPIGIGVFAWQAVGDIYIRDGQPDCHWVTLYDFVDGQYWMVFDSYDSTHKKLAWNFGFTSAIRYSITAVIPVVAPAPVVPASVATTTIPVQSITPPVSVPISQNQGNWVTDLAKELWDFFKDILYPIKHQTT